MLEWNGDEAATNHGTVRIIDVREPEEFDGPLGHIPGAENIPMGRIVEATADWDREQPLLIVCRSGRRSHDVAEQLTVLGFSQAINLRGGMLDYRGRGHRVA